jgi:cation transport regulator ChaB
MNFKHYPAPSTLPDEERIVWLRPAEDYDYVREISVACHFKEKIAKRDLPQTESGAHTVAYAVLKKTARWHNGYFHRRVWYVTSWDRTKLRRPPPEKAYGDIRSSPCEGVDPRSIIAGQESKRWEYIPTLEEPLTYQSGAQPPKAEPPPPAGANQAESSSTPPATD